jgi:hypothetical protein
VESEGVARYGPPTNPLYMIYGVYQDLPYNGTRDWSFIVTVRFIHTFCVGISSA